MLTSSRNLSLYGKVAIVTESYWGIGRITARKLVVVHNHNMCFGKEGAAKYDKLSTHTGI